MNRRFTLTENIERIPFLRLFIPLVAGVVVAPYVTASVSALLGMLGLLLAALIFLGGDRVRQVLIAVMILVLGVTATKELSPSEQMPRGERLVLLCDVADHTSVRGRWQQTTARVTAFRSYDDSVVRWYPCDETILLNVDTSCRVSLGDRIGAVAYVSPLDTLGGTSSYARTMRSRGIMGRAYVIAGRLVSVESRSAFTAWERIIHASKQTQQAMNERLSRIGMDEPELAVAQALMTGDKHLLDKKLRDNYSKAGVSHVLAISGLHLGIIFLILNYVLMPMVFVRHGRFLRSVLIILILWAYAFVSGLSASVLRSAFMLSVVQLSLMTVWRYNSYNALFSSAFVLVLINPGFIYDISFQMSYLALFSILFFYSRFSRWFGIRRVETILHRRQERAKGISRYGFVLARGLFTFVSGTIVVGLSAQIGVAPLVGYVFGRIPLLNLLINPVIMVVITLIMAFGFLYLLLAVFPFALCVGRGLDVLLTFQNRVVEWTSSFRFASVEDVVFPSKVLYLTYILLLLLMVWIKYLEQRHEQRIILDAV